MQRPGMNREEAGNDVNVPRVPEVPEPQSTASTGQETLKPQDAAPQPQQTVTQEVSAQAAADREVQEAAPQGQRPEQKAAEISVSEAKAEETGDDIPLSTTVENPDYLSGREDPEDPEDD